MNKKVLMMITALLAVTMLFGACAQTEPPAEDTSTAGAVVDNDTQIVIAEVNGNPIYKDAYDLEYEAAVAQYTQYGIDAEDETYADVIQEEIMTRLVDNEIFSEKLEELEYTDSADINTKAEEMAQQQIDNIIMSYYADAIYEELGEDYTDEDLAAAMDEYDQTVLEMNGLTWEDAVELFTPIVAEEVAKEDLVGDIEPSEAEVQAKYDENLESYIADVDEDPTVYVTDALNGQTVYYTPTGVRNVRQVLVKIDEDAAASISLLRENGYDAQADQILETALAAIKQETDDILSTLQSGDITFDAAIEQYNEDTGMPDTGYSVMEGTDAYVPAFTEDAMKLENIGDFSQEPVPSDFGYHIIEYYSDVAEGAIEFETVSQQLFDELKTTLQDEQWNALFDQWKEEAVIEYYYENLE